jgi:hypothetical protein
MVKSMTREDNPINNLIGLLPSKKRAVKVAEKGQKKNNAVGKQVTRPPAN